MKHERRTPTWLLRDLPALLGLAACFAMFVWPFIIEGFRVNRGHMPREDRMERIAHLLLNAEATLAYALWREAYRRLGFNHRLVQLELAHLPATRRELLDRVRSYLDQFQNLSRAAAHYTALLRQRYGQAPHVPHGSTGARLRRAAHHAAAGVSAFNANGRSALMVSSAQSARPSNHEGVLANARGPPGFPRCLLPTLHSLSAPTRLRSRPRAPFPLSPTQSSLPRSGEPHAYPPRASCHDRHRGVRHRLRRRHADHALVP